MEMVKGGGLGAEPMRRSPMCALDEDVAAALSGYGQRIDKLDFNGREYSDCIGCLVGDFGLVAVVFGCLRLLRHSVGMQTSVANCVVAGGGGS